MERRELGEGEAAACTKNQPRQGSVWQAWARSGLSEASMMPLPVTRLGPHENSEPRGLVAGGVKAAVCVFVACDE